MKIAVLCGYLPSYQPLGLYTIDVNKRQYCQRHGYHLEVLHGIREQFHLPGSHSSGFSWSRLAHMADMVESGKWDWVWCVGADTLITNLTITLESIIEPSQTEAAEKLPLPDFEHCATVPLPAAVLQWSPPPDHKRCGKKHLLICGDRAASMQADSFLVRGTPEGSSYLRDILAQYEHYKTHIWVENQAMIDLREKHAAITYIVPQWMLNSYDYSRFYHFGIIYRDGIDCYGNRGQWHQGDFMIHWPAGTLDERLLLLEKYTPKIQY